MMKSLVSLVTDRFSPSGNTVESYHYLQGVMNYVEEGVVIYNKRGKLLFRNATGATLALPPGPEIKSLYANSETGVLKIPLRMGNSVGVKVVEFENDSFAVVSEAANDRLNIRDKTLSYLLESGLQSGDIHSRAARALGLASGWRWIGISRFLDEEGKNVEFLGWWDNTQLQAKFESNVAGAACETVNETEEFCFYSGHEELLRRYPNWDTVKQLNLEAYAGLVYKVDGKPLGHVIAMHNEPVSNSDVVEDLLQMVTGLIGTNIALEQQSDETQRARKEARTDALTGFGNRLDFDETYARLSEEYNSGRIKDLLVINADLDGLKGINDTLGHASGDQLIFSFAEIARKHWRPDDYYFRTGGDEFILLIPNLTESLRHLALTRMQNSSDQLEESNESSKGLSFGICFLSEVEGNAAQALDNADKYMYRMKAERRPVSWRIQQSINYVKRSERYG